MELQDVLLIVKGKKLNSGSVTAPIRIKPFEKYVTSHGH